MALKDAHHIAGERGESINAPAKNLADTSKIKNYLFKITSVAALERQWLKNIGSLSVWNSSQRAII
jgi:hypothetical protein